MGLPAKARRSVQRNERQRMSEFPKYTLSEILELPIYRWHEDKSRTTGLYAKFMAALQLISPVLLERPSLHVMADAVLPATAAPMQLRYPGKDCNSALQLGHAIESTAWRKPTRCEPEPQLRSQFEGLQIGYSKQWLLLVSLSICRLQEE